MFFPAKHETKFLLVGFTVSLLHTWCYQLHFQYMLRHLFDSHEVPILNAAAGLLVVVLNFPAYFLQIGTVFVDRFYVGLIGILLGSIVVRGTNPATPSRAWTIVRRIAMASVLIELISALAVVVGEYAQTQRLIIRNANLTAGVLPAFIWTVVAFAMHRIGARDPQHAVSLAFCHSAAYVVSLLHFAAFLLLAGGHDSLRRGNSENVEAWEAFGTLALVINFPASLARSFAILWLYAPVLGYAIGFFVARYANSDVFIWKRWSAIWWIAVIIIAFDIVFATWMLRVAGPHIDFPVWLGFFWLVPLPYLAIGVATHRFWRPRKVMFTKQ